MNNTKKVMSQTPVLNVIGNVVFRQCKPKITYERFISHHKRNEDTPYDIENRLREKLRLISIVRG